MDDLHRFLPDWPIGNPVELTVMRGKELSRCTVPPGEATA